MLTKDQLTERRRGKGGTLVRLVGSDETFVVKDLMNRKGYDIPTRIGIGPVDNGLAFGVWLDRISLA